MKIIENFALASCFSFDLDFSIIIRNSLGQTEFKEDKKRDEYKDFGEAVFDISIYDDGELVFKKEALLTIPCHGFCELYSSEIGFEFNYSKEYLIIVTGHKEREDESTMAREYGIKYFNKNNREKVCSLLYDAFAYNPDQKLFSPINLINHKCWTSSDVECAVYFLALNPLMEQKTVNEEPIIISILSESGQLLHKQQDKIYYNSVYKFDLKKHLKGKVDFGKELKFFNVIASGYNARYPIFTVLKNNLSGNLAIEHSLPPYYYFPKAKDFFQIRENFIKNLKAIN